MHWFLPKKFWASSGDPFSWRMTIAKQAAALVFCTWLQFMHTSQCLSISPSFVTWNFFFFFSQGEWVVHWWDWSPSPGCHQNPLQQLGIPSEWFWYPLEYEPEKAMAPHSSTLAWKIPWTEEPRRLQSMGSLRVGHDWATSLSLFAFMHWRRK